LGLDGYTTNVNRWLRGDASEDILDSDPSSRIKGHLLKIEETGTIPELEELNSPTHQARLRLRSVRGLGIKQVAAALSNERSWEDWVSDAIRATEFGAQELFDIWQGTFRSSWESAHIVPPLLRLLRGIENVAGQPFLWTVPELGDGLQPISSALNIWTKAPAETSLAKIVKKAIDKDRFFRFKQITKDKISITHILGWNCYIEAATDSKT
jgi:hypothetical protein